MLDLNNLRYFVHVVDAKGFTAASKELNIPKSRLSRRISELEESLQVRLLHRSSRQFSVTDIGATLYEHAKAMLVEADAAQLSVQQRLSEPAGTVKLACSIGIADFVLEDVIPGFLRQYPRVNVIQDVSNRFVDPVGEGFDLVIRAHVEPLPDSSLIQKSLAQVSWGLFASPDYLSENGCPESVSELACHSRLVVGTDPGKSWKLWRDQEAAVEVSSPARYRTSSMANLKRAAIEGIGIVALPAYVCSDALTSGILQRVLPRWHAGRPYISLLMPSRRGLLPAVKALAETLSVHFRRIDERSMEQHEMP
ncbi:LysR substrate-binding domain-containing protein [Lacimicrobium alkaliphilum]|uniref:HTH lysR-type domain-containing protein n=1 Tax=Lacimicrobium alkaliphilum TaxID=1526571 RepID=A0A0U3AHA6_9ALTE|nr:LysR substrate-binding domain-containing protein [Lacimicrobium alkaliphilum]ALS98081.1 hypothetical protein AT746_07260 [Lacimicrobium alkaliphilum]